VVIGELAVALSFAGVVDTNGAVAGTLAVGCAIVGQVDGTTALAVDLTTLGHEPLALAGEVSGAAFVSVALAVDHPLAGNATGSALVDGIVGVDYLLVAVIIGASYVSGRLSIPILTSQIHATVTDWVITGDLTEMTVESIVTEPIMSVSLVEKDILVTLL